LRVLYSKKNLIIKSKSNRPVLQVACGAPKASNLPDLQRLTHVSNEGGVSIKRSIAPMSSAQQWPPSIFLPAGDVNPAAAPAEQELQAKLLVVMMSTHPRLGATSGLNVLTEENVMMIINLTEMKSIQGCLRGKFMAVVLTIEDGDGHYRPICVHGAGRVHVSINKKQHPAQSCFDVAKPPAQIALKWAHAADALGGNPHQWKEQAATALSDLGKQPPGFKCLRPFSGGNPNNMAVMGLKDGIRTNGDCFFDCLRLAIQSSTGRTVTVERLRKITSSLITQEEWNHHLKESYMAATAAGLRGDAPVDENTTLEDCQGVIARPGGAYVDEGLVPKICGYLGLEGVALVDTEGKTPDSWYRVLYSARGHAQAGPESSSGAATGDADDAGHQPDLQQPDVPGLADTPAEMPAPAQTQGQGQQGDGAGAGAGAAQAGPESSSGAATGDADDAGHQPDVAAAAPAVGPAAGTVGGRAGSGDSGRPQHRGRRAPTPCAIRKWLRERYEVTASSCGVKTFMTDLLEAAGASDGIDVADVSSEQTLSAAINKAVQAQFGIPKSKAGVVRHPTIPGRMVPMKPHFRGLQLKSN
jgi:hypothetical protein